MYLDPRIRKAIIKFLDAAATVVTSRMLPDAQADEPHLTSTLRETLDERFSSLHALPYSLAQLREDLAREEDETQTRVAISFQSHGFTSAMEHKWGVDFGLVVRYQNHLLGESWESAALLQAKRVHARGPQYSADDRFKYFNRAQLETMGGFADGRDLFHYIFYCPQLERYDDVSSRKIRDLSLPFNHRYLAFRYQEDFWRQINGTFGYTEEALDRNRPHPSILVSRLSWPLRRYFDWKNEVRVGPKSPQPKPPTVAEAYGELWNDFHPLSWFVVALLRRYTGSEKPEHLDLALGRVSDELPELSPRYTFEVKLTVGHSREE